MNGNMQFSVRQRQVIAGVTLGLCADEIAEKLGVSSSTVKAHANATKTKLRVEKTRQIPQAFALATGENPFLMPETFAIQPALKPFEPYELVAA